MACICEKAWGNRQLWLKRRNKSLAYCVDLECHDSPNPQFNFILYFKVTMQLRFPLKKKKKERKVSTVPLTATPLLDYQVLIWTDLLCHAMTSVLHFQFLLLIWECTSLRLYGQILKKENGGVVVSRYTFVTLHWQTVSTVSLMHCLPSSSVRPTGRSPRWGQQQRRQPPLSCHPTAAHPEPGGEGHAAESARRASGPSVESVTSARTWRSLEGRVAWSSHALWDSV